MTYEATILTSLHGGLTGITANGDLVLGTTQATDITGVGAKNGSTVAAIEVGAGPIYKTKLTLTALPLTFTDEAGQGQRSGVKIYDFPAGLLCFLGAVIDGSLTLITASWGDTFDGDLSLGTAVNADSQGLDTTAVDLMQATAMTQAIAQVANCDAITIATALTESGARWHDGTATAKDLYINFEIDDDAAHVDQATGTFTGTVEFMWMILGDN